MSSPRLSLLRLPPGTAIDTDWRFLVRANADLATRLAVTGWHHSTPPEPANDALATLVAAAATDPVAARVVLQRLVPGLVAIARRRAKGRPREAHAVLDELLGAGWFVIRSYPIHRRPRYVAAGLLREIEYQAFTRTGRLAHRRREVPLGSHEPTDAPKLHPFEEAVDLLATARDARLPAADLQLAVAITNGRDPIEIARAEGVTPRMVRYRRAAMAARLRTFALGEEPDAMGAA